MARGGKRPGAGRKPKPRPMTPEEVQSAADRAEGIGSHEDDPTPRGRGRPSKYQPLFARQAERLCRQGATDADLAAFFEIALSTLYLWKLDHSEFSDALTRTKEVADDAVVQSLFRRATGYTHDAVKIMQDKGSPVVVPYVEHYPPDTVAAIFWLKNRRPDLWRDKPPENGGGAPLEIARKIREAVAQADAVEDSQ